MNRAAIAFCGIIWTASGIAADPVGALLAKDALLEARKAFDAGDRRHIVVPVCDKDGGEVLPGWPEENSRKVQEAFKNGRRPVSCADIGEDAKRRRFIEVAEYAQRYNRELLRLEAGRAVEAEPRARVPVSSAVHYARPSEQAAFKAALQRAGVPYTLEANHGVEQIRWDARYDAQVEKIQRELFGPEINGSNVSFGDATQQRAFAEWLTKRGMKYQVVRSRGEDHVVWEGPQSLLQEYIDGVTRHECNLATCNSPKPVPARAE